MHQGFRDWLANGAYWDGGGYRLKSDRRRRAPWSEAVMSTYPEHADFHEAAQFFTSGRSAAGLAALERQS